MAELWQQHFDVNDLEAVSRSAKLKCSSNEPLYQILIASLIVPGSPGTTACILRFQSLYLLQVWSLRLRLFTTVSCCICDLSYIQRWNFQVHITSFTLWMYLAVMNTLKRCVRLRAASNSLYSGIKHLMPKLSVSTLRMILIFILEHSLRWVNAYIF